MAKYKTDDAAKFAKMVGGNMRFLRLNHTPFRPQKVLAHFLGLTFQQVQKYESGKNIPCAYRLVQIADFYKVTPNDLVNPSFIHNRTKDNEVESKHIKNSVLKPIDSPFGHCAANPGNDKNFESQLDKNINELLKK